VDVVDLHQVHHPLVVEVVEEVLPRDRVR